MLTTVQLLQNRRQHLDQSLNVDDGSEEAETSKENTDEPANLTATQRLVVSNKQISDVDRQLSQQFYHSSFMPAIDQMPSKWSLYGKPYTIILFFIILGILIGSVSSYTILAVTNNSNFSLASMFEAKQENTTASNKSVSTNETNANATLSQDNTISNNATASESAQLLNDQSDIAKQTNQSGNANVAEDIVADASGELTKSTITNLNLTPKQVEEPVQRKLVNGVLLEAGQQVLGYQGPEDTVEESPVNSSRNPVNNEPPSNSDQSINSELYRRIQRAAKDVDEQPSEPNSEVLKVTNLNDLPRIDQLSPAILTQMPAMSFSAHMYASNPQDRWVRVNSRRLGEGDLIGSNVTLKRIEAEKVVLDYKGTEFTMNALSDW